MYAKAVALCGLGVLAGAGALVDYWPVSVRYPFAPGPVAVAVVEPGGRPKTVPAEALAELDLLLAQASVASLELATEAPADVPATSRVADLYASLPVIEADYTLGTPLEVESLPAPAFVAARYELPVVEVAPAELLRTASGRYLSRPYAPPAPMLDDDSGFLSSAFRKTGSSIVRTGVRTGSSLAGAVRVMGSVVRRAWPN